MKIIKTCLSAAISSVLIFSPMAYADKWSDQFPHIKATGDIPGDCSYEKCLRKITKVKLLK
jgi:multiple sugar transport system substrate-binding protein